MPRLKIANGTWILVGDGRKALFLRNDGLPEIPNLHCIALREQSAAARETGREAPGRTPDVDPRRSTGDIGDVHDQAERRFAVRIAADLNAAAHDGRFDRLIVVAPPQMLATLRGELSCEARACLQAEIDKDLTRHTLADIETILMAAG